MLTQATARREQPRGSAGAGATAGERVATALGSLTAAACTVPGPAAHPAARSSSSAALPRRTITPVRRVGRLGRLQPGQAAHDGSGHSDFTDAVVATWTDELRQVCEREGMPPESAQAEARLLIASVRGLLLDRLLTGDETGTDVAFQRLLTTSGKA